MLAAKTKWGYVAYVQGVILQKPVTDFPMTNKGHTLTLNCLFIPIPNSIISNPNFNVSDSKSHSQKRSQIFFLNME